MRTFKLTMVTPDGGVVEQETESLVVPGEEGSLGLLAGHAPMIAALRPGLLTARRGGERRVFAVRGGVIEASREGVLVLADELHPAAGEPEAREQVLRWKQGPR